MQQLKLCYCDIANVCDVCDITNVRSSAKKTANSNHG